MPRLLHCRFLYRDSRYQCTNPGEGRIWPLRSEERNPCCGYQPENSAGAIGGSALTSEIVRNAPVSLPIFQLSIKELNEGART